MAGRHSQWHSVGWRSILLLYFIHEAACIQGNPGVPLLKCPVMKQGLVGKTIYMVWLTAHVAISVPWQPPVCIQCPSPEANPAGFEAGKTGEAYAFAMFSISCFIISYFHTNDSKKLGSRWMTHAIFLTTIGRSAFITLLSSSSGFILVG